MMTKWCGFLYWMHLLHSVLQRFELFVKKLPLQNLNLWLTCCIFSKHYLKCLHSPDLVDIIMKILMHDYNAYKQFRFHFRHYILFKRNTTLHFILNLLSQTNSLIVNNNIRSVILEIKNSRCKIVKILMFLGKRTKYQLNLLYKISYFQFLLPYSISYFPSFPYNPQLRGFRAPHKPKLSFVFNSQISSLIC